MPGNPEFVFLGSTLNPTLELGIRRVLLSWGPDFGTRVYQIPILCPIATDLTVIGDWLTELSKEEETLS